MVYFCSRSKQIFCRTDTRKSNNFINTHAHNWCGLLSRACFLLWLCAGFPCTSSLSLDYRAGFPCDGWYVCLPWILRGMPKSVCPRPWKCLYDNFHYWPIVFTNIPIWNSQIKQWKLRQRKQCAAYLNNSAAQDWSMLGRHLRCSLLLW